MNIFYKFSTVNFFCIKMIRIRPNRGFNKQWLAILIQKNRRCHDIVSTNPSGYKT